MNKSGLYVSEIYSAIQGEGPLVGVRQIFVRLSGCDLRCVWCDTPGSLMKTEDCEYEEKSGFRKVKKIKNPILINDLLKILSFLNPSLHHSISLTGGEPLLQSSVLFEIIPQIKNEILLPVYLETGGHRPENLKEIIHLLDYVSMDFKLPTSSKTKLLWEEHERFLSICTKADNLKNVWVKAVITSETDFDDLIKLVNIVKLFSFKNPIEIIVQPVSELNGVKPPSEQELLNVNLRLSEHYKYLRVIPQVHKLVGQK